MELWQLREFLILAEQSNFNSAANRLLIGRPVLTRHISELEEELGAQLCVRNKHSIQLTTVGSLLLEESHSLLNQYDKMIDTIRLAASGLDGCVKIGFLGATVKTFLVAFSVQFNQVHPKIQLQFTSFDYVSTLSEALKRRKVDVGFTISLGLTTTSKMSWKTVYHDRFSAVVPLNHPLANESTIDIAKLTDEHFILYCREQKPIGREYLLSLCEPAGFDPNIVRQSSQIETVLLMVEMGAGITILPHHTKVYASSAVRYIDLAGDNCHFDVVIAWKTTNSNPALSFFLKTFDQFLHP